MSILNLLGAIGPGWMTLLTLAVGLVVGGIFMWVIPIEYWPRPEKGTWTIIGDVPIFIPDDDHP